MGDITSCNVVCGGLSAQLNKGQRPVVLLKTHPGSGDGTLQKIMAAADQFQGEYPAITVTVLSSRDPEIANEFGRLIKEHHLDPNKDMLVVYHKGGGAQIYPVPTRAETLHDILTASLQKPVFDW